MCMACLTIFGLNMRFLVVFVSHAIGIKWIELHCKRCFIALSSCEEYLSNLKRAAMLKTTSSSWYSIKAVIEAKGNQQQYVSTANLFIDHVGGKRNDRRCQTPTNISTACPATSGLQVFLFRYWVLWFAEEILRTTGNFWSSNGKIRKWQRVWIRKVSRSD